MTPPAATLETQAPPHEADTPAPAVTRPPAPVAEQPPASAPLAPQPPAPVVATRLPPPPPPANRTVRGRVDRRLALWLGIGCPAMTAINIAIEPVPANPAAPVPVAVELLFLVFTAAVIATAVYAVRRDSRIFPYAVSAGVMAVFLTVTCPASGHHAGIGWWWYTQMALSAGFLALGAAAWRRHRTV